MGVCYFISGTQLQLTAKNSFLTQAHFVSFYFGTFAKPVDILPVPSSRNFTRNIKQFSYFVQILWKSPLMIFYHSPLSIKCEERNENEINFPYTSRFSDGMQVNAGTASYKYFYCPTNVHNVKKRRFIKKAFKIKEATPTCFCLQGNHHQGATDST